MTGQSWVPGPPLSSFVDCFWLVDEPDVVDGRERALPDGAAQLIFALRRDGIRIYDPQDVAPERRLSGAIVTGPRAGYAVINPADVCSTVGVAFKPGQAGPFLGVPASTLIGTAIDLEAIWGRAATSELHERLLAAGSAEAAFRLLEATLLRRLAPRWQPPPAVAFGLRELAAVPHRRTIADVADEIGLSHRGFIAQFRQAVGLTPKRFCRVRRFQEALGRARCGRPVDWADVAAACGYFDQSHLVHDFRAFSGLTPGEYARLATAQQNHVRLS